jgi:hypothetical protein
MRYEEIWRKGWRAAFLHDGDGDGALADERDGYRMRAHAKARDAAGGVGGVAGIGHSHEMPENRIGRVDTRWISVIAAMFLLAL